MDAAPAPSDSINGTLMGPVVTPPESKATGTNCLGTKNDKAMVATYIVSSMYLSGMCRKVRIIAITRNTPTPTPTDIISTNPGTPLTCSASTLRSGSATVISVPTMKLTRMITHALFFLTICLPI